MARAPIVGCFCVIVTAGCAAVQSPPPAATAAPAAGTRAPAPIPAKPGPASPAKPPAPVAAKPPVPAAPQAAAPATLDLASLERQLRETKGIGVMTKIAIKNQVDDLLGQFRAYYDGRVKTTLAELRRPYEVLVLKVLSLLQDADPALARSIHASREAIWGILSDRNKFSKVKS